MTKQQTALVLGLGRFGGGAAATFSAITKDYLYFCMCITLSTIICFTLFNDQIDHIEIGDSVSIKTALG